mmetsp:Transcript_13906/g.23068  ORF Transcript_13906/g.23068 Transcript_13906/m.23068 type:complete len:128 (+) Transcript_13906:447-830(+)
MTNISVTNDDIAIKSSELQPTLIYRYFGLMGGLMGESITEKNIGISLRRVLEQRDLCYHAVAFSDTKDEMCILSKQQTSMETDPKMRKDVKIGERLLLFKQYLVHLVLVWNQLTMQRMGTFSIELSQ